MFLLKYLSVGIFALALGLPIVINNGIDNNINVSKKSDTVDSKWVDQIIDSSQNNNIQLFVTRNASLIYQECLIATNYMLLNGSNKHLTWLLNGTEVYLNDNKYDLSFCNGISNNNQIEFIRNSKQLGFDTNNVYDDWLRPIMINHLLNYYQSKFGQNFKIDLWIPDINIEFLWGKETTKEFYDLLKHVNKINIISDGNYQTKFFAKNFESRLAKTNKQLSKEEAKQLIIDFQNDDINNSLYESKFKQTTVYDFLLNNDFITVFNIASYQNSSYYDLKKEFTFYNVNLFEYDYYKMALAFYPDKINPNFDKFINMYETFFRWSDIKSFSDLIVDNKELYNPNKKNVIFIGDSLITDTSQFYKQRVDELTKTTQAFLKKFNPNEYNWIFKGHPRYNLKTLKYFNSFYFKNSSSLIYLESFPWEMFLSWDYKQKQNPTSSYDSFFGQKENLDNYCETTLIGFQYTSTVIETTWFYLKNIYNLSDAASYNSVNAINFPISSTFDIIRQTDNYNFNYKETYNNNVQHIIDIHEPYFQTNPRQFVDYKKDLINTKTFINSQNIDYDYETLNNNTLILAITISVIVIFILIGILIIVISVKGKKQIKENYEKA